MGIKPRASSTLASRIKYICHFGGFNVYNYMKPSYTPEILQNLANESFSLRELITKLGIVPRGGNYKTVKKYILEWQIDISNFK